MTVATQTKKVTATGNGSATTFSFSPVVMTEVGDIVVTTTVIATGVETVRTQGTGSTNWSTAIVAGDYPTTGSIVYPADTVTPLASTHTITISRLLTLEQQTDLENQGGYFPETHEQQYDKFVMIDLQQQEVIDRTLAFPLTYTGSIAAEVPAPLNANYYLRVNVAGDALEWTAISTATASASDAAPLAGAITAAAGTSANFSRNDHVHPQTFIKGGDISSASPLVIDTDGRYFIVTGTTNFAAMTVAANRFFILEFAAILTMTHGAGTLDLPGAANITTAAGDVAICMSTASNVVTVVSYMRATATIDPLEQGKHTIWVPAGAMRPAVTNGCSALTDVETTALRPDMQVLDFATGADDHAQFSVAFPKNWNAGTVTFRAFWTSTATDTDGVAIGLQGVSVADNVTIDAVYGTAVVVTDDAQGAAEECYITAESGAVTISNAADDALTFFQVFRDVSNANDDMTEDMRLLGIQLFYTSNAKDDT
jgi:hypothetical protein